MKASLTFFTVCFLACAGLNHAQKTVCSSLENNVDYKGNDLTFTYDAKSADACANICSVLSSSCTGFTYWTISSTNSICFLKNFTRTPLRYPAKNRQSCIMVKNPNPTTPTTTLTTASTTTTTISTSSSSTDSTISTTSSSTDSTASSSTDSTTSSSTDSTTSSSTDSTTSSSTDSTTTTTAGQCALEENAYYGDANVAFDFKNANNVAECCTLCIQDGASCSKFSYLQDTSLCFIYADPLPEKQFRANTIGGSKSARSFKNIFYKN